MTPVGSNQFPCLIQQTKENLEHLEWAMSSGGWEGAVNGRRKKEYLDKPQRASGHEPGERSARQDTTEREKAAFTYKNAGWDRFTQQSACHSAWQDGWGLKEYRGQGP